MTRSAYLSEQEVPESVESVFGRGEVGRDVADHDSVAETHEGVFEHHCEFAASEGGVAFALVEGTYALLQGEQRLVDLGAIDLGLLVLVHVVCSSFVACQVDEGDFCEDFFVIFQTDLQNGV